MTPSLICIVHTVNTNRFFFALSCNQYFSLIFWFGFGTGYIGIGTSDDLLCLIHCRLQLCDTVSDGVAIQDSLFHVGDTTGVIVHHIYDCDDFLHNDGPSFVPRSVPNIVPISLPRRVSGNTVIYMWKKPPWTTFKLIKKFITYKNIITCTSYIYNATIFFHTPMWYFLWILKQIDVSKSSIQVAYYIIYSI